MCRGQLALLASEILLIQMVTSMIHDLILCMSYLLYNNLSAVGISLAGRWWRIASYRIFCQYSRYSVLIPVLTEFKMPKYPRLAAYFEFTQV